MSLYNSPVYIEDLNTALVQVINIDELYNSKIMVAGASGLIGSYIVDMLLLANEKSYADITIYALGRNIQRLEDRFDGHHGDGLILIEQDITEDITPDIGIDFIINAAGNAYPAAFNKDPVGTISGNIVGTRNLLNYGMSHRCKRFLYVSSGEIYGQGDITLESFVEDYSGYIDILEPRSCYPLSKRSTENLCVAYSKQYGLDTVIVRPCHTYGPNTTPADNRASVQFVNDVLAGRDIVLKSSGEQMRSYCYISDCASAILTVLINGKTNEAYNIAFDRSRLTIAEFAELLAKAAGKSVVYKSPDDNDIAERTPIFKQVLSSKKLENLGWNGSFTPEIGINHLLRAVRGE